MTARYLSGITIRKLGKGAGLLLTIPGNYAAHLGPYREVAGRESVLLGLEIYFGSLRFSDAKEEKKSK